MVEQKRSTTKVWSLWIGGGLMLLAQLVSAEIIYHYVDAKGDTYFTDHPLRGGYKLKGTRGSPRPVASYDAKNAEQNRRRYSPMITAAARRLNLQPELLHAVVRAESAYDPRAISRVGAVGLMQLMPGTAQRYGVSRRGRYDPEQNLKAGAHYLRDLLREFKFDLRLALAAYNAGENAVKRYGNKIPPYPETQRYVRKVLAFYNQDLASSS